MKEKLTPKESLEIISGMIQSRKSRLKSNGFMILFWGWLVIAAAAGQMLLLSLEMYNICWTPWLLTIVGAVFSAIRSSKNVDKKVERSHLDSISGITWIVFSINVMILGFIFAPLLFGAAYVGIVLILLGMASIVEGNISQFRPLIVGGIIANILGFSNLLICVFMKDDPNLWIYAFIILIIGIVVTNIIPGYIVRRRYNE